MRTRIIGVDSPLVFNAPHTFSRGKCFNPEPDVRVRFLETFSDFQRGSFQPELSEIAALSAAAPRSAKTFWPHAFMCRSSPRNRALI